MRDVVRRRRLRELGVDDARLQRHLRRGTILRVGYDRFVVDRPEPTDAELMCAQGSGFALGYASAGLARGLPVARGDTHVVVPNGSLHRWFPPGVVVHQTRNWDAEVVDGLLVTSLERTIADLARTCPLPEAVAVVDAGLRMGADRAVVLDHLGQGLRGARHGRRAVELSDARAESPLESQMRAALALDGIPPDDLQKELVAPDGGLLRVDGWYDLGVVLEADGFEFHSSRAPYRRDRWRMQAVAGLGCLYLPFTWEDVVAGGGHVPRATRQALAARCGAGACTSCARRLT